ncbi:C40 family peptidase [Nicoliella spurrieriana]|uniref:C40 family peptidase n=1 Tax=Nicoliella spurrieriana TaxID=2925830 RepID=A0A976X5W6_9LACO|nr:C40 family peptidase [Nicoliella spurrieriana]UQS87403.1 C40 family peptidase [Nicoliella spurrieriana]
MIKHLTHYLLAIATIVTLTIVTDSLSGARTVHADTDGQSENYDQIYKVAKAKLGTPYSYGATGPSRFDCSGFTQYVYRNGGDQKIARTAQAQYNTTQKVSKANRQKGDLVYFGSSKRSISHVGLYIGNGKMINAQNRGVIVEAVASPWWNAVGYSRP